MKQAIALALAFTLVPVGARAQQPAEPKQGAMPRLPPEVAAALAQLPNVTLDPNAGAHPGEPLLRQTARAFHAALLRKDVDSLSLVCKPPFFFEGRQVSSADEVKRSWLLALQAKPLAGVENWGIEFLTPDQMVSTHGKAPDKLAAWPVKDGIFTVASLSGHPIVVLWRKNGAVWQAVGFHD